MDGTVFVGVILLISSVLTIVLILKKPKIAITIKNKRYHFDTFFFGALLGLCLILFFGLLNAEPIQTKDLILVIHLL